MFLSTLPCFHPQYIIGPVWSVCNFHKWLLSQWDGGCRLFPASICSSRAHVTFSSQPTPPSWFHKAKETQSPSQPLIRSFQLCGSIVNTSGWFEFLPSLPNSLCCPLCSSLFWQLCPLHSLWRPSCHSVRERRTIGLGWTKPASHPFTSVPISLICPVYATKLALNCDWFRDFFSLVPALYSKWWFGSLFLVNVFSRNAAFSIYYQISLPSYSNLYLWNLFTLYSLFNKSAFCGPVRWTAG